jgi:anti-sigma regulatory factor (Ser/Thr protein kinase)
MPTVELAIPAQPVHVRTARLVAVAAGRRAGLQEPQLDELRLAVGEACARAVAVHERHGASAPVRILLHDDEGSFGVEVLDVGPAPSHPSAEVGTLLQEFPDNPDVAIAFLRGLVEDVAVTSLPEGTQVRLRWKVPAVLR